MTVDRPMRAVGPARPDLKIDLTVPRSDTERMLRRLVLAFTIVPVVAAATFVAYVLSI